MVDTCVMCGDIVPEGTQICHACNHGGLRCPDCSTTLKFMTSCRSVTIKQILYSRLYHCEHCHADWEVDSSVNDYAVELKRKFWG